MFLLNNILLTDVVALKVEDLIIEQEEYWKPLIFENDEKDFFEIFEKINTSQFPGKVITASDR